MLNKSITGVFVCVLSLLSLTTIHSCKKDKGEPIAKTDISEPEITESELFAIAKDTTGFRWYKNAASILSKSSGSGHTQPFLKTRYNSIAGKKLDAKGKVLPNETFPEGSLIVKDLYKDSTTIGRYAILYKKSSSSMADAKGWVWGYINADGSVAHSIANKGNGCIGCHSQTGSIDYMLMNKYFP